MFKGGDVLLVNMMKNYVHFPLSFHPTLLVLAQAAVSINCLALVKAESDHSLHW